VRGVSGHAIVALPSLPEDKQESAAQAILNFAFDESGMDLE
jgi:hypothetical protein